MTAGKLELSSSDVEHIDQPGWIGSARVATTPLHYSGAVENYFILTIPQSPNRWMFQNVMLALSIKWQSSILAKEFKNGFTAREQRANSKVRSVRTTKL